MGQAYDVAVNKKLRWDGCEMLSTINPAYWWWPCYRHI